MQMVQFMIIIFLTLHLREQIVMNSRKFKFIEKIGYLLLIEKMNLVYILFLMGLIHNIQHNMLTFTITMLPSYWQIKHWITIIQINITVILVLFFEIIKNLNLNLNLNQNLNLNLKLSSMM